ncbi:MAG: hypothetical protein V2A56_05905 [bacterium]
MLGRTDQVRQQAHGSATAASGDALEPTADGTTSLNQEARRVVFAGDQGVIQASGKRFFSIGRIVSEVAQRGTSTTDSWVRSLVRTGDLEGFKIRGKRGIWISEDSFLAYFEKTGFEPELVPIHTSLHSSPVKEGDERGVRHSPDR